MKFKKIIKNPAIISNRIRQEYLLRLKLPRVVRSNKSNAEALLAGNVTDFRQKTLTYVEANKKSDLGAGFYSYTVSGPPLLYASCYAALIRHLYGDLDSISNSERNEWIAYIQAHQSEDGLFRDKLIEVPEAENYDWWGWRHLTLHALMALSALGGLAQKTFAVIDSFRIPGQMSTWLESRQWSVDAASVSNEIQNNGTMLQYARDFQGQDWCSAVIEEMFDWLDRTQDNQTGYWWYTNKSKVDLSLGVQTGYHLWLLYFYDRRPIRYIEKIIDSCLATQNDLGGFGVAKNSSACEDIDSIDPLVRLSVITDYRREDVDDALKKALPWVLANFNPDGGAVFRRYENFIYGHPLMSSFQNQSSMFPTWFRTLSLALISSWSPGSNSWKFVSGPGLQFFES